MIEILMLKNIFFGSNDRNCHSDFNNYVKIETTLSIIANFPQET